MSPEKFKKQLLKAHKAGLVTLREVKEDLVVADTVVEKPYAQLLSEAGVGVVEQA
jgi:hypothetical protein